MKKIYILFAFGLTLFLIFNMNKAGLANTNYLEQQIDLNSKKANSRLDTLVVVPLNVESEKMMYLSNTYTATGDDITACEGSTVTLIVGITGGTPSYSFDWTGPNGFSRHVVKSATTDTVIIVDISPAQAGTYSFTITDSNENSVSGSFNVSLSMPEVYIITDENICAGDNLILEAETVGNIVSWEWYGPGPPPSGFYSEEASPVISNVSSINEGEYTLIIFDSYGCYAMDSKDITVTEMIVNAIGGDVCLGETLQLQGSVTGGIPPINYYWTGPEGFTSDQQNPILPAFTEVGEWTYSLTVTDANECTATEDATVIVHPDPMAEPSYTGPVYEGSDLTLLTNWIPAPGEAFISVEWYKSGELISSEMDLVIPYVSLGDAGTYTLVLTNEYDCEAEYTIEVEVLASEMFAIATGDTVCLGEAPQLLGDAIGGIPPISYSWTGPDGFSSSQQNPILPASTEAGQWAYNLTVTDANENTTTDDAIVIVNRVPLAVPSYTGPLYEGDELKLIANPSDEGPYTFYWSGPNGFISNEENPLVGVIESEDSGIYTLQIMDEDETCGLNEYVYCEVFEDEIGMMYDEVSKNYKEIDLYPFGYLECCVCSKEDDGFGFDFPPKLIGNLSSSIKQAQPNVSGPPSCETEVNTFSGNFLIKVPIIDISGYGPALSLEFAYNSCNTNLNYGYGNGWTFNYNLSWEQIGDNIHIHRGDGREDVFTYNSGAYLSPVGVSDTLIDSGNSSFILKSKYGMEYHFTNSSHKRLTKVIDRNKNELIIEYSNSLPTKITGSCGRSFQFKYKDGLLSTVVDENITPVRKVQFNYDMNHNLVEIIDPMGYAEKFIYNKNWLVTQLIDKNRNVVDVIYTENHAVSSIKSAISIIDFEYSQAENRTFVNRLVGGSVQTTDYTFDSERRVIEISSNCCGSDVQFGYNSKNDVIRITDASGYDYLYTYDKLGNVLTETDPLNNTQEFLYDPEYNQLIYWKDRNGNETTYNLDNSGNIIAVNLPLEIDREYSYYSYGLLKSYTDGNDNITNYTYNGYGNLSSVVYPVGTEYFTYDGIGNRIYSVTPNGDTTYYKYDIRRELIKTTDPLNNSIENFYDGNGNMIWIKNKRGFETSYEYDAHNRLVKITEPLETVTIYGYDEKGNLTYQKDPNGNETFYKYNNRNLITEETNALGNTRYWEYDFNGNLVQETNFRGFSTNYVYDSVNRRIAVINAAGDSTKYQYDANGNNTAVFSPDGIPSVFEYDETDRLTNSQHTYNQNYNVYDNIGNLVEQVDAMGNSTFFEYDANGRLTKITDALGQEMIYIYDDSGNKIESVDKNGNSTYIFYDGLNQPVTYINALGDSIKVAYDENGNQISITNENGYKTEYSYNELGERISVQYPIGVQQYQYDKNGNKISFTDPLGRTTTFEFDAISQLIKTVYPDGSSFLNEFDENGNLISETNEENEKTIYTYDSQDNLSSETNAENETITYHYDNLGNLKSTITPSGNIIQSVNDKESKQIAGYDNQGRILKLMYDLVGNIISESDGNGNTKNFEFDALGQNIKTIDQKGDSILFVYDFAGNLIETTDRENNSNFKQYDALNRLIEETDPMGNKTKYAYDKIGNLISVTDANENETIYEYDGNNRLIKETYFDSTSKEYTYDDAGNLISKKDNSNTTITYSYDNRNRIINKNYPGDNDNIYEYDAVGRLTLAQNNKATIRFGYDKINRLLYEDLNGHVTSFEYDSTNKKRTISYSSGDHDVNEFYDERNRLKQIDRNGSNLIKYYYDSQDNLISQNNSNGTTSYYSYNSLNWISSVKHSNSSGNFIYLNHLFDNEGNKIFEEKVHNPQYSESYSYNGLYQLTGFQKGNSGETTDISYSYDPLGNRIQVLNNGGLTTYTANEMNEYTSVSGIPDPIYDENGNLINDGVFTYQYDYENQLISVNNGEIATYEYDALKRRIKKTTASGTVNYYYDGDRIIEEKDDTDETMAVYIYATGIDDIQVIENESGIYFYHKNSLGSIVALSNESGNPVEFYEYDAYGNVSCFDQDKSQIESPETRNPYLFTGRRYDDESKLYDYRARMYDPINGRFLQRDPTGYTDGLNLYEYVRSNPVNNIDPFGLGIGFTHLGWKYGPVPPKAKGVTNVFYRASISCHCQDDGQYHMKVDTIEFGTSVFVKQNLKNKEKLKEAQGVYGHEMRHVKSLREAIDKAKGRFQTLINKIEKKPYGSRPSMCTSRIGRELRVLITFMEEVIAEGAGHDNDLKTTKPQASTPYDEDKPLPTENKKLKKKYKGYYFYPWPKGEQW